MSPIPDVMAGVKTDFPSVRLSFRTVNVNPTAALPLSEVDGGIDVLGKGDCVGVTESRKALTDPNVLDRVVTLDRIAPWGGAFVLLMATSPEFVIFTCPN